MIKLPPYSIEAEKAVLGAILLDPDECVPVCHKRNVTDDQFYDTRHKSIYKAISDIAEKSGHIDLLTVTQHLHDRGLLDRAGGSSYLTQVATSVVSTAGLSHKLDILLAKYTARRILEICNTATQSAGDPDTDPQELLNSLDGQLLTLRESGTTEGLIHVSKVIPAIHEELEAAGRGELPSGLSTGIAGLDTHLNGMKPGQSIIIAARPGRGKTALGLNIAFHTATTGTKTAFFSLEMTAKELCYRLVCADSRTTLKSLLGQNTSLYSQKDVGTSLAKIATSGLYINDKSGLEVRQIFAEARLAKKKHDIGLIVIDYIGLVRCAAAWRKGGRVQEIGEISRAIKTMAKELDVPIITLAQVNREGEDKPKLSNLKESGDIEQDADVVIFLHEELVNGRPETSAIFAKARNAQVGTVPLKFEKQWTLFLDKESPSARVYDEGDF